MPDTPGGNTPPKTVRELVEGARESFTLQLARASLPPLLGELDTARIFAAFNNAITELSMSLDETALALGTMTRAHDRLALELADIRALSKRKTYSVCDPVCGRCLALAAELGDTINATPARDGEVCSRCGAGVVEQRKGESEAAWRARYRATPRGARMNGGAYRAAETNEQEKG